MSDRCITADCGDLRTNYPYRGDGFNVSENAVPASSTAHLADAYPYRGEEPATCGNPVPASFIDDTPTPDPLEPIAETTVRITATTSVYADGSTTTVAIHDNGMTVITTTSAIPGLSDFLAE